MPQALKHARWRFVVVITVMDNEKEGTDGEVHRQNIGVSWWKRLDCSTWASVPTLSLSLSDLRPYSARRLRLVGYCSSGCHFDNSLAISGVLFSRGNERLISVSINTILKVSTFFPSHPITLTFLYFSAPLLLFLRCRSYLWGRWWWWWW